MLHCCKWPTKIKKYLAIWSHCQPVTSRQLILSNALMLNSQNQQIKLTSR